MNFKNEDDFLRKAKQHVSSRNRDFICRTYHNHPSGRPVRYLEALQEIGLTSINQVWNEILSLRNKDHFVEGPITDNDRPHEGKVLWIYKKEINGCVTYIKMKIDARRGCVCLSFHKDW